MLNTTYQKTINGTSSVKTENGDVVVATMYAAIQEDGNTSISKNINNKEVYEANKAEIREDMGAFEALVYSEEDLTQ